MTGDEFYNDAKSFNSAVLDFTQGADKDGLAYPSYVLVTPNNIAYSVINGGVSQYLPPSKS